MTDLFNRIAGHRARLFAVASTCLLLVVLICSFALATGYPQPLKNTLNKMGATLADTFGITAGPLNASVTVTGTPVRVSTWAALVSAVNAAPTNGTQTFIAVTTNFNATSGTATLKSGQKIVVITDTAVSPNCTITRQATPTPYTSVMFDVPSGATLTLQNIVLDGNWDNTLLSGVTGSSQMVNVQAGATCNLYAGSILRKNRRDATTDATSTNPWATVVNHGALTLDGGLIQNNVAYNQSPTVASEVWGVGVYSDTGAFNFKTGTISGNTYGTSPIAPLTYGAGVYIASGTSTMQGSTTTINFTNNSATFGGAVYQAGGTVNVGSTGFVTLFQSNMATNGGAIYQGGGSLSVDGGTLQTRFFGNTASNNGGAIFAAGVATSITDYVTFGSTTTSQNNRATNNGGAIYAGGGAVTVEATTRPMLFRSNTAANGGAIYQGDGELTVRGSASQSISFLSNKATGDGGAICIGGTSGNGAKILDNIILGTTSKSDSNTAVNGGAVAQTGGVLVIQGANAEVKIRNNNATELGGGLYTSNATTSVLDDVSIGGKVEGSSDKPSNNATMGGGIYQNAGSMTLEGSANAVLIQGNTATTDGAGIYLAGNGSLYLRENTVIGGTDTVYANRATNNGGGIFVDRGSITMSSTTFAPSISRNVARNGAGVYLQGGSLFADGGTAAIAFIGNTATADGGAVYATGDSTVTMRNNVVIGGVTTSTRNRATGNGAGFYVASANLTLQGGSSTVQVLGNAATGNGGGIYQTGGSSSVSLVNKVALGTTASGGGNSAANGGGIYQSSGVSSFSGTTGSEPLVQGNRYNSSATPSATAGGGGGLFVASGTANLGVCTIDSNVAGGAGKGTNCYVGGLSAASDAKIGIGGDSPFGTSVPVYLFTYGTFEVTSPLSSGTFAQVEVPTITAGSSRLIATTTYTSLTTGQLAYAQEVKPAFTPTNAAYIKSAHDYNLYLYSTSSPYTAITLTIPTSSTTAYTGQPVGVAAPVASAGGATVTGSVDWEYSTDGGVSWQWGLPTNVGSYKIRADYDGSPSYQPAVSNVGDLTITLALYSFAWAPGATDQSAAYTGQPFAFVSPLFYDVNNVQILTPPTYSYRSVGSEGSFTTGLPTSGGQWTVRTTVIGDQANYGTTYADAVVTISKAVPVIDAPPLVNALYDGSAKMFNVAHVWGVSIGESTYVDLLTTGGGTTSVVYKNQGAAEATYTTQAPSAQGAYDVRVTFSPSVAQSDNYSTTTLDATLVISLGTANMTIQLDENAYTYSGAPVALLTSVRVAGLDEDLSAAGSKTYQYSSGSTFVAGSATTGLPTNAGTYAIRVTFGMVDQPSITSDFVISISKASATVYVADRSVAYTGGAQAAPTAMLTGVVSDDLSGDVIAVSYEYFLDAGLTQSAGTPIAKGVYYVKATYSPSAPYAANYATSSNASSPARLTITKATLASDRIQDIVLTRTYTGTSYAVGPIKVLAPNGDDITSDGTLSYRYAIYINDDQTTYTAYTNGRPTNYQQHGYKLEISYSGTNADAVVTRDIAINQAPLSLTVENKSRLYGVSNPTLTYSASGFVDGEGLSSLSSLPTLVCNAVDESPVGQYPILISGATATNYAITQTPGLLTINQVGTTADPVITRNLPATLVLGLGQQVEFLGPEAHSTDGGTLSYEWYTTTTTPAALNEPPVGGTLVPGETSSTLAIDPSSAGTTYYYCVITNTSPNSSGDPASIKSVWSTVSVVSPSLVLAGDTSADAVSVVGTSNLLELMTPEEIAQIREAEYGGNAFVLIANASVPFGGSFNDLTSDEKAAALAVIQNSRTQYPNGLVFGMALDVSLYKNILDAPSVATKITNTGAGRSVTVTYHTPVELAGIARNVAVVRLHQNGSELEATILPNESGNTEHIKFTSDKFSTYILVYEPEVGATAAVLESLTSAQYVVGAAPVALVVNATYDPALSISYQWHSNTTPSYSGSTLLSDETSSTYEPSTESAGVTYFFCDVTTMDSAETTAVSRTNIANISVGNRQDYDGVSCSTCHYADTRAEHGRYVNDGTRSGSCVACHEEPDNNWNNLRGDNEAIHLSPMGQWADSCGAGDNNCHGSNPTNSGAAAWHGNRWADVQTKHRLRQWNGTSAELLPVAESGCSQAEGSDSGCHSVASNDSRFYFGAMDISTSHNDYWTALMSDKTTSTALAGTTKFASKEVATSNTHGCAVCHSRGELVLNRELANVDPLNTTFNCTTCHKGQQYFPGGSDETSLCVGVGDATAPTPSVVLAPKTFSATVESLLAKAVSTIKTAIFGSDDIEPALYAAAVEPLPVELPRAQFPVGSLIDATAPFKLP